MTTSPIASSRPTVHSPELTRALRSGSQEKVDEVWNDLLEQEKGLEVILESLNLKSFPEGTLTLRKYWTEGIEIDVTNPTEDPWPEHTVIEFEEENQGPTLIKIEVPRPLSRTPVQLDLEIGKIAAGTFRLGFYIEGCPTFFRFGSSLTIP